MGVFFIHLETRRVEIAGTTRRPDQYWMEQVAGNVIMEQVGFLNGWASHRYAGRYPNSQSSITRSATSRVKATRCCSPRKARRSAAWKERSAAKSGSTGSRNITVARPLDAPYLSEPFHCSDTTRLPVLRFHRRSLRG